jgi:hypothetical protein
VLFKNISSLVSLFSSTIFSFQKLVCNFWQIARLREFFINYRIGSHEHLDKLLLPPFVIVLLPPHHLLLPDEELGWMSDRTDDETDGWKGRPHRTD